MDSQIKKHDSLNIDRFIQRKKLAKHRPNSKIPMKTFLFIDAECFLKENSSSSRLNYVFLDVEKVKKKNFFEKIEICQQNIVEIESIKKLISLKFHLNVRNVFLYRRNSAAILSIKDIPWPETTIFVCN